MPDKALNLFESYNMAISEVYDKYIESKGKDALKGITDNSGDLDTLLEEKEKQWENTGLEELDGWTPGGYFNSISSVSEAMDIFRKGAVICDVDMPKAFLTRLLGFGLDAVNGLISLAVSAASQDEGDEDRQASLMAITILGKCREKAAAAPMIETLLKAGEGEELLLETIQEALIQIGEPAIPVLIRKLYDDNDIGESHEYLLTALAGAGKNKKTDDIYHTLKSCFLKMGNKIVGASCLAEYGDGRAIPLLRGYIEKNLPNIDRNVLYEVKIAVENLGGSLNDLLAR